MKLNFVLFLFVWSLSAKILADTCFCELSKLKCFVGTYFCKFGENLQNSQKFQTRYTHSWCDTFTQNEHVIS